MRFTDAGEGTFGANAGLPDVAVGLLAPLAKKYVAGGVISHADLWALAANVAIKAMGGPDIPTRFGRVDAPSSAASVESQVGRLPDGDKGIDHLREIFAPKGFDDKDIVALSGAHTVGKCSPGRSGFDGPWTEEPLKFDNSYFKEMLSKSYAAEETAKGCPQHRHAASGTIMLISDLALLTDSAFKTHVERYAADQQAFFADFTTAWVKLQENGVASLRNQLLSPLDSIKADLSALVTSKGCGPILIRLSWHDAGVYSTGKLTGGCPNAAMRFTDAGEGTFGANAGLPDVAVGLLAPLAKKYVAGGVISHADLWALAANVAIKAMGGPDIPTRFGRVDAPSSAASVESQVGRLPDGDKGIDHLREIFAPKGFDDKDIVALSGAHTVGKCSPGRSGFDGPWTEEPLKFDNSYFKEMLSKSYAAEETAKGCPQHRHAASGTIMLISDLALLTDSAFKTHVERYAADQQAFFADFTTAWVKLQENGVASLREGL